MPVYRFRSHDEARQALWIPTGSPDLAKRLRRFWAFMDHFPRTRPRPGVTRFRSIDDPERQRQS